MKTMTKILGIGLIVLIAMVGIGAVSAYEIYDDTNDQPSVYYDDAGVEYRDVITGSFGGIEVDDWVVPEHEPNYDIHVYTNGITDFDYNDDTRVGFGSTFKGNDAYINGGIIYNNGIDIRPKGIGYDVDPTLSGDFTGNYADGNGGAIYYTNGGLHDGNLYFYTEPYYTNGMTGSLSDGNGNLLVRDVSGFVVPGSDLNPPRPDINIPYYPTDVTEI